MQGYCTLCQTDRPLRSLYPALYIVECEHCGLVFYNGSVQETSHLYRESYFRGEEYRDYPSEKKIHQKNFQKQMRRLQKLKPSGSLLEIGSAYGFFLEMAQTHWRVQGVDITPAGVEATQRLGIPVQCRDFLELPIEKESIDIICLWDTLEHLPRPIETIERAAQWLRPGGILALTTGDISSTVARWQGIRWRQIHPPTHLYYFSHKTLQAAFEKAGLDVLDQSYIGYYRSWRSMVHGLFELRNPRWSWLSNVLTVNGRLDFPLYSNLWDILLVTGRKKRIPY